MMSEQILFLGNSQTFLGVLITLNILCIFANKEEDNGSGINDNNFILRFIRQNKEGFNSKLRQLETLIKNVKEEFRKSEDYKTLQNIITDKDKNSPEIVKEANAIDIKCSKSLADSNTIVTNCYIEMDRIEASNELSRAPLFTLLFGLIFFLIDEICNLWQSKVFEPLIMFSVFFISLSSVYWIVLWSFLFFRRNFISMGLRPKTQFWDVFDQCADYKEGGFLKIVICASMFYAGAYGISYISIGITWKWIIVLALAVMPMSVIGFIREVNCRVKGNYSFLHMTGHLLAFIVYSAVLVLLYYMRGMDSLELIDGKVIGRIRFSIIAFSLLNGVVFPFMIPFLRMKRSCDREMKKLSNGKRNIEGMQEVLSTKLGFLCKKMVARRKN